MTDAIDSSGRSAGVVVEEFVVVSDGMSDRLFRRQAANPQPAWSGRTRMPCGASQRRLCGAAQVGRAADQMGVALQDRRLLVYPRRRRPSGGVSRMFAAKEHRKLAPLHELAGDPAAISR